MANSAYSGTRSLHDDFRNQWSNIEKKFILHLVRATEDFMGWIDPDDELDWQTSKKFDAAKRVEEAEFQILKATIGELECVPTSQRDPTGPGRCLLIFRYEPSARIGITGNDVTS